MKDTLYVVAIHHGCEGHSPPLQAFWNKEEAIAALALIDASGTSLLKLYPVPVWPKPVEGNYWDVKPIPVPSLTPVESVSALFQDLVRRDENRGPS